jgi:hypothetical protein
MIVHNELVEIDVEGRGLGAVSRFFSGICLERLRTETKYLI